MEKKKTLRHEIKITPDHPDGIYSYGEKAAFKVEYFRNGKLFPHQKLEAYFHQMDYPVRRKNILSFLSGKGKTLSIELNSQRPSMILKVFILGKNGKPLRKKSFDGRQIYISSSCGVIASPEKCTAAKAAPPDFDLFWEEGKKELASIPLKVLEKVPLEVPEEKKKDFLAWDMKVSCAGPAPVSGYLTMPKDVAEGKRKVPAIVTYQGGGVRSAILEFQENAILFNINAHGIVNGKEPSFYLDLSKNALFDYIHRGVESRETFYFRYMYLRLLRAQEFVRSLPQWDKKDLILAGGSQGGAQTLVGAALDPYVTLAHAWVPALCNLNNYDKNYSSSWPCPFYYCEKKEQDFQKVGECVPYFDAVHFAAKIKCKLFMAVGLLDSTCPPENVFAAYNAVPSKEKTLLSFPDKGHVGASHPGFQLELEKVLKIKK